MATVTLHEATFEPYISEAELGESIAAVATGIQRAYDGKRPLFLGVLNGAYFFASELLKRLPIECEISFVKVASYHGMASSGTVSELIGVGGRLEGRHVVVVEDIVDTGNTLEHIMAALKEHHPASVAVATMLMKPEAYKKDIPVEHVALRIPNAFVVGSGLDHDGLGRNLPGIYRIKQAS